MQHEFEKEQDALKKKHSEQISLMQKEFDNEKHLRKEKFSMQISKYMKSGKSFDELDENEEKRELAVSFLNDCHIYMGDLVFFYCNYMIIIKTD